MRPDIVKPLKRPKQKRSTATVTAILQATTYILMEEGFARLTTNRIAERAGVNIASLYQYFPNKAAIIAQLQREHVEEARTAARDAIAENLGESPLEILRALIRASIVSHQVNPELHRVLTEEIPLSARTNPLVQEVEPLDAHFRTLLDQFGQEKGNDECQIWLLKTILYDTIHKAITERPKDIASGALERELLVILQGYLTASHR